MDKKNRKVDPDTFWFWLTNEVGVGKRKGVGDAPIPQSNGAAWMEYPDNNGSEIIIHVYDGLADGMTHRCGDISFRFTRIDNEQFEVISQAGGTQSIKDYFEQDLLLKIDKKYPGQPEPAQLKIRGRSSQVREKIEGRRNRVRYQRAQGKSISDLAAREDVSQETIERDLGLRK